MGNCLTTQHPTAQAGREHTGPSGKPPIPKNVSHPAKSSSPKKQIQNLIALSMMPNLNPSFPKSLVTPSSNPYLVNRIHVIPNEFIEIKVPKDFETWTQFHWVTEPMYGIPPEIASLSNAIMHGRSFQEKYAWFRYKLQSRRISWTSGKSQYLEVDRHNLLMSSNSQFEKINFYKEVKIIFKEEKDTSDAGGLLREWMNLCIKEIFDRDLNLLSLCDAKQTYYKFNFNENVKELFEVASRILGVVIGKAIFERIPLKCFLNYTILRQLCCQPIQVNDIYTYDKDFYSGWQFMIKNNMITSLEQNFCVYEFDEHGTQITIPLKQNGYHIMVNSTNKEEYISLMIQHYCIKSVEKVIANLKYGLYKIIPADLLSIFQPHELDMIISGKQYINVADLKANTVYSGYKPTDQIIQWFWNFVQSLNNQKLQYMLHFVTGNGRVPINGFKYLESNRGEFQKFHIAQVPYDSINPYPKSHTCFNRLELPMYPNKQLFDKYIEYVALQISYFGLE